jgi:PadR family transcriptional regulator PadR
MARSRRPSAQTVAVLRALAAEPTTWHYGYPLCLQTGLKAGSLYPILMRLAERGLLETAWEHDAPHGRPPRHLYRLSGPGLELAATFTVALSSAGERQQVALRPLVEGA